MEIKANDYDPKDIFKFMRQATDLTQKDFAKTINKSKDWCQSNELGRTNYLFKDLLELANKNNFEIIIKKKWNKYKFYMLNLSKTQICWLSLR